ncbi:four-carbon acid sugar kinase family protein [Marinomonas rhizomae]|uniref:Uncharacterized protein YgbK (DUF1537 family) n=1 Tax=Marinomonas rhizomae TaxID=491948 RepID=A0A366J9I8_9GAMM|nr:four-carbon acid sugar kinase family protein [Marinomonas rhizomae]RBP83517.1 uncharacterized protein YgbK (DUF1537 family) [Marinomonas rhizomae]RNF74067.1 four-carbon acid sugar kinase family protein [Marinomonas rhizomae]
MNSTVELAFYGDDFTGSTDVLESLSLRGKKTILLLRVAEGNDAVNFSDYDCVGVAGISRSKDPAWMRAELPKVYRFLNSFDPKYIHYKVCSTFDSNLHKGNLAVATQVGIDVLSPRWTSIVVGTPKIKRYVCFGELFADSKGETYRIDRHPIMSCHPATPMTEANLVKHMHQLGEVDCASVNISMYSDDSAATKLQQFIAEDKVVVFDSVDHSSQAKVGVLINEHCQDGLHFSVSSSGFEDALYSQNKLVENINITPKSRILALSGSCSSITSSQIDYALSHGFIPVELDIARLLILENRSQYLDEIVQTCIDLLRGNKSPLVYSALGPQKSGSTITSREGDLHFDEMLGSFLGAIALAVTKTGLIERLAVAGGDTSGYCIQSLNLDALTFIAPLCPGVPLCRAHAQDSDIDGLEVALKGGQMGSEDFFFRLCSGGE